MNYLCSGVAVCLSRLTAESWASQFLAADGITATNQQPALNPSHFTVVLFCLDTTAEDKTPHLYFHVYENMWRRRGGGHRSITDSAGRECWKIQYQLVWNSSLGLTQQSAFSPRAAETLEPGPPRGPEDQPHSQYSTPERPHYSSLRLADLNGWWQKAVATWSV